MKRRNFLGLAAATASILALSSCSKKTSSNIVTNFTLKNNDIVTEMLNAGVGQTDNFFLRDENYSLPDESFMAAGFAQGLRDFFFSLHIEDYKEQENDCDDFALGAAFYMSYLHHNTAHKVQNTGIAFGEFYYVRDRDGIGHAINVAVTRDKNKKIKIIFFEPQTYSIVELSNKEKDSCVFWRL